MPVTLPAFPVGAVMTEPVIDGVHIHIRQQLIMTPDTVLLHYFLSGFFDLYHLWFSPHRKNAGVIESILSLKVILIYRIILRYVAIITMCHLAVRAVLPGEVLRIHHVAVDTSPGVIRQVASGIADADSVKPKAHKNTCQDYHRQPPPRRRNKNF
jgi:hypothetical protein